MIRKYKPTLRQILVHLLGNRDQMGYDRYFMTLTCLLASFFVFFLTILNIFVNYDEGAYLITTLAAALLVLLYATVRFTKYLLLPKIILSTLGLLLLDIAWITEHMSLGPNLFFLFAFGSLIIWLWHGKQLAFMVAIYMLNVLLLFLYEYFSPDLQLGYETLQRRAIDIYISFSAYICLSLFLLYIIKKDFINQKDRAVRSEKIKTAFLTNMSHEIRTPMNAIIGFSELLKDEVSEEKRTEYLEIIQHSGDNLLNLINDIVDLSKIDAGEINIEYVKFDLKDHFQELEKIYSNELMKRNKGNVKISYELPEGDTQIYTDRFRINQILSNLIQNAIKFTFEGEIKYSCKIVNDEYLFSVSDMGIGIPEDQHQRIFERFTKNDLQGLNMEGTGIGLAIVDKLTALLGGRVWLSSKPGQGTIFFFTIPLIKQVSINCPIKKNPQRIQHVSEGKIKILIVEDDPVSAKLLRRIIGKNGYSIDVRDDGLEAVEYVRAHMDTHLILMDLRLPGLSGYDATSKIREFNTEIVIIAQSANAISGDREKALEAGCNDYISKPLDVKLLKSKINTHLMTSVQ